LVIDKGTIFHIDPTDTKWLKINSRVVGAGSTPVYSIGIEGSARIDSVRITGWDQLKNKELVVEPTFTAHLDQVFM
jgi:hypothetical protein